MFVNTTRCKAKTLEKKQCKRKACCLVQNEQDKLIPACRQHGRDLFGKAMLRVIADAEEATKKLEKLRRIDPESMRRPFDI
jgi:hypothetical protein